MIVLNFKYYKMADELPNITNPNIYSSNKHEVFTKDGLYSEQIFGPVKNFKCQCGKLFGKINAGKQCKKCEVLCDKNSLRSELFAKIQLPEGIYIVNPDFKNTLRDIFGRHAIKMILNKASYNNNKEIPYYFSIPKNKLIKSNILAKDEEVIDLPVFDITSLHKLFLKIRTELDNPLEELIDPETGEFYSEEELLKNGVVPKYKYLHILKEINPEFLDYIFLNFIPVTDPNSRQVIKISKTKIIPHPISKAYIEILKNISKGTSILDNLYNENSDFFGNTVYKYQNSVDAIYDEILQFNFQKKENYVRESLTGKTIEFSQRAVLIPNPVLRPYEMGLPEESIKKIFLPEILRFLFTKYQENEIELIKNGEIYKCDIFDYIQYIYSKFDNNFDLDLTDKDYEEFLNNHMDEFLTAVERQPNLWKYSVSSLNIARSYGDGPLDELQLIDVTQYGISEKYQYLIFEALGNHKNHLLDVKNRSNTMYRLFKKNPVLGIIAYIRKKILQIEGKANESDN